VLSVPFRGVYCPVTTPFDHRGELYPSKIRQNLTRLNRTGLAGYVIGDIAGEGSRLATDERIRLFAESAPAAGENKTLVAAVSSPSNAESQRLANSAAEAGFHFAAVRPAPAAGGDAAQALYFRTLADQSPLPLILLNEGPEKAPPALLVEIARHPNVAAISGSGGDVEALLASEKPLLSACETRILEDWRAGVRAFLLPLANVAPFYLLCIEEALRTRDEDAAADLEARGRQALAEVFGRMGPAGLKRAMDLRGAYGGSPRLPGLPLTAAEAVAVEQAIEGLTS